jgi:beta-lactamase class A
MTVLPVVRFRDGGHPAPPVVPAVVIFVAAVLLASCSAGGDGSPAGAPSPPAPSSRAATSPSAGPATTAARSPAHQAAATRTSALPTAPAKSRGTPSTADRKATEEITRLTAGLGPDGVSVAAVDVTTGKTFGTGARGDMTEGSIAKLDIIETLLLQHQKAGTALSPQQVGLATTMIENSDNDAANSLWSDVGTDRGVRAANVQLGLKDTVLGTNGYWGLSTTDAADQLALLTNLVSKHGPLTASSQRLILGLMRKVEADQRWGVGVTADAGTDFANKNGWLSVISDDYRWLVNSLGVLTIHGQTVLLAVLTQHNQTFDAGIDLTEQIARAVVPAIT